MDADDSRDRDVARLVAVRTVLLLAALVWYSFVWLIGLTGCATARTRYRHRQRSPPTFPASSAPGVSVLRPLKGLDTNLFENLESTFTQDYPTYELLLSVASADDEALPVARQLIEKYPLVDANIVIGEEVVGANPKVNNLVRPCRYAKYDILWVLDSNVLAAPGALARSVEALTRPTQRRAGLVHHVPFAYAKKSTLGASLEEAYLATSLAKIYLGINTLRIDVCVNGKSNLYRRSDIEQLIGDLKPISKRGEIDSTKPNGFSAFGRFSAEDNMIGNALWHELGLRHELSCDVAANSVANMSFTEFVTRRIRWIRVRKRMATLATFVEPLSECFVMGAFAAWIFGAGLGISPWLVFACHCLAWMAVDADVYTSLAGQSVPPGQRTQFLGAWFLREVLALPLWVIAIVGDEVEWRGGTYRVLRHGEVERLDLPRPGLRARFSFRKSTRNEFDESRPLVA